MSKNQQVVRKNFPLWTQQYKLYRDSNPYPLFPKQQKNAGQSWILTSTTWGWALVQLCAHFITFWRILSIPGQESSYFLLPLINSLVAIVSTRSKSFILYTHLSYLYGSPWGPLTVILIAFAPLAVIPLKYYFFIVMILWRVYSPNMLLTLGPEENYLYCMTEFHILDALLPDNPSSQSMFLPQCHLAAVLLASYHIFYIIYLTHTPEEAEPVSGKRVKLRASSIFSLMSYQSWSLYMNEYYTGILSKNIILGLGVWLYSLT